MVVDAAAGFVGLALAFVAWRGPVDRPALEPAFLQRVWYWDDLRHGDRPARPGHGQGGQHGRRRPHHRRGGERGGHVGAAQRLGGPAAPDRLRANYALAITLGLAAVIVFLVSRVWWS